MTTVQLQIQRVVDSEIIRTVAQAQVRDDDEFDNWATQVVIGQTLGEGEQWQFCTDESDCFDHSFASGESTEVETNDG